MNETEHVKTSILEIKYLLEMKVYKFLRANAVRKNTITAKKWENMDQMRRIYRFLELIGLNFCFF